MSYFLETVRIGRFGGLADREVGPFGDGLNIVYGPNEAGKTTVTSFVKGVLFGWEDAHGVRNRYLPETGGRTGELIWRPSSRGNGDSPIDTTEVLARTEAGVTGAVWLLGDVDQDTFDTIFSLTSDELRSLRGSPDVTAKLLTASAGTAADPSSAFVEIERRIANTSVYRLSDELEEKRAQVKAAAERERLHIQEDRELRELKASRATTADLIASLEGELDDLMAARAELSAADKRAERISGDLERLREELSELPGLSSSTPSDEALDERLLALDAADDRVLGDRLDELAEEQEKIARSVEVAKENSATSTAAYEALCELDEDEVAESRRLRNRPWQALVSVLLPIAFIAAGIPLFVHGRQINSLSITALGVSLVVVSVFFAVAAFFVLFRRPHGSEVLETRRKDAQWVMLQDKKKLDASVAEREAFDGRVRALLDESGLARAGGSIRQARLLLDEARVVRTSKAEEAQREKALRLRMSAAERELSEIAVTRDRIADATGLQAVPRGDAGSTGAITGSRSLSASLDALIREKTRQRDALLEAAGDMGERYGELSRELDLARADRSTDQLKLEYHQVRTRLREAKSELIMLLLARRILERSIATWENQGQPEVYARAGSLLGTITGGRWVGVSTSQTGSLVAVGADGVERDPRHLSLGTCQQLYLALRISLLLTVESIGRSIPVLADDILVNFDSERRRGAAVALAELARRRQVIVFTCHRETVEALREADSNANCIDVL